MSPYERADQWLRRVAQQPLPDAELFAAHVAAGRVTSLCDCGCHGFTFSIAADVDLKPLAQGMGLYCELAFESNLAEAIHVLLHTDSRGYLSAVDITHGPSNTEPMPEHAIASSLLSLRQGGN
jgi:hypothetical protein